MLKSLVDDLLYMIIRQRIIHDLGLSAEFDQSGKPECFQLVRDRRFGDSQQNRKVAYTHLALFQSMKDLHSCAISEQLEKLYKSLGEMKELSTGVTTNVTNLNRVLTNVKARGTWAEVQLEGILDQTIPNMYEKNFATRPGSSERVEFAIRIPAGDGGADAYLPVDSKFPMEDYVRLCSADSADAEEVAKARKALEDRVLSEAKLVTKYINVPATTPFAIMYLATEGLYAEIASSRTGIAERIQREYNIMIAGPTTITALLNSLSMGFRAVAINEKANEVRRLLSVAKAQYEKFGDVLDKAKKKIDEAGRTLVAAQDRNRIMAGKLKEIESMDAAEADAYLGIAEQTDGSED